MSMTIHDAVLKSIQRRWLTATEIRAFVNAHTGHWYSDSAITARVRDLRKTRYGAHDVQCRMLSREGGKRVYEYRV